MGKVIIEIADYNGEKSSVLLPTADFTAENFAVKSVAIVYFRGYLDLVQRGRELSWTLLASKALVASGKAADKEAQREEKALVRFYDSVTFRRATMEIPCIDMTTQIPGLPGVFFRLGVTGADSNWTWLVTHFESLAIGPSGNAPVVEEIIHVGRNT